MVALEAAYAYTANGQIATVADANGNLTSYAYDGYDRLKKTIFPSKTTIGQSDASDYEEYSYDANANMVAKRARSGATIAFLYDNLNRLLERSVPGAPTHVSALANTVSHEFAYDLAGRRTLAKADGALLAYAYDGAGRLLSQTHNGASAVAYQYDPAGNRTRLTYPDAWYAGFTYDALGRAIRACANLDGSACANDTSPLASLAYDPLSRRASLAYENGAVSAYDYSMRGDLLAHSHDLPGGGAPPEIAYGFAYNAAGQLTARLVNDAGLHWSPPSTGTDAYTANGLNQYTDINSAAPVHDLNGNVTTDHNGRVFSYDAENVMRTAHASQGGAELGQYAYYADGMRRQKIAGGATRLFYYDGDQEIAEYEGSTLLRRYLRLPGSVDEPFLMIDMTLDPGCTPASFEPCAVFAHQDRLGSVIATTDAAGAIVDKYNYGAYGELGTQSASGFPFRFTGQKLDPETGLYYYKARYYDPETGRFLQTDPIGYKDQMNLYAYVGNDPLNNYDPIGLCSRIKTAEGITVRVGICAADKRTKKFLERLRRDKRSGFAELDKKAEEAGQFIGVRITDTESSSYKYEGSPLGIGLHRITISTVDEKTFFIDSNGVVDLKNSTLEGKLFHELGHAFHQAGLIPSTNSIDGGTYEASTKEATAVNFENAYYRRIGAAIRPCYANCSAYSRQYSARTGNIVIETHIGDHVYYDVVEGNR